MFDASMTHTTIQGEQYKVYPGIVGVLTTEVARVVPFLGRAARLVEPGDLLTTYTTDPEGIGNFAAEVRGAVFPYFTKTGAASAEGFYITDRYCISFHDEVPEAVRSKVIRECGDDLLPPLGPSPVAPVMRRTLRLRVRGLAPLRAAERVDDYRRSPLPEIRLVSFDYLYAIRR